MNKLILASLVSMVLTGLSMESMAKGCPPPGSSSVEVFAPIQYKGTLNRGDGNRVSQSMVIEHGWAFLLVSSAICSYPVMFVNITLVDHNDHTVFFCSYSPSQASLSKLRFKITQADVDNAKPNGVCPRPTISY
ncbi:MAG: hypothetical protein NTU49_09135 [Gammaproteobacteria bacterium]|nr:hypothetical protein [Gammaproteobacteria bacterium]